MVAKLYKEGFVKIILSNTESSRDQIYKFKDFETEELSGTSSTSSYFIGNSSSVEILNFINASKDEFYVDIENTKNYIDSIRPLLEIVGKDKFIGNLHQFDLASNSLENKTTNFSIGFADASYPSKIDTRGYIRFRDGRAKEFKHLIVAMLCDLVIYKLNGYNMIYPVIKENVLNKILFNDVTADDSNESTNLKNNYLITLAKNEGSNTKEELAEILDNYYIKASYKKTGIHLFAMDYYSELKDFEHSDYKELILLTKNINTNTSYIEELKNGVKIVSELLGREEIKSKELINKEFNYKLTKKNGENLIVYGTPGCGKSYYVQHTLIEDKGIKEENVVRTTFYQDYTNTDFVGQILPKVHADKSVTYEFNPGPFTIALRKAITNPNENVALIIEEINRGNAASIFGDIFQLLDRKNGLSEYSLVNVNIQDYLNKEFANKGYEFDYIKIPGNLHIYATMNTSDQNVFTLDTAFKRRWKFKKLINEFKDDHKYANELVPGMRETTWKGFVKSINRFIKEKNNLLMNEDKQIGVYFVSEDNFHVETFDGNKNEQIEAMAYKMLEYLWDDVVKYDRDSMFKNPQTLDDLVREYKEKGEEVFVDGIIEKE